METQENEETLELLPEVQFFNKANMTQPTKYLIVKHLWMDNQFKEGQKKLVLQIKNNQEEGLIDINTKNRNFLIRSFGAKPSAWTDQQINVYTEKVDSENAKGYTTIIE